MFREARIYSLAQVNGQCVLVLEEMEGPRLLPIWIGLYEGGSIGMALQEEQKFPRPLTHDLFLHMLGAVDGEIKKILVTSLKDGTFYAEIHIALENKTIVLDARPSDSIALAVRQKCPIFVADEVFEACPELLKPISDQEVQDFKKKLDNMNPADFYRDLKSKDRKKEEGGGGEQPLS